MKKLKFDQNGQTMVEYILLVAVVIVLMTNIFKQLNDYILNNPNSTQNRLMSSYRDILQGKNTAFEGRYKNYTIPK